MQTREWWCILNANVMKKGQQLVNEINVGTFTITNQKSNSQPLHSAHPFHCTYVMYVVSFDFYCFYVLFHLHFICYSALGPQVFY